MSRWLPLAGIALLATLAGMSLWLAGRGADVPQLQAGPAEVTPAALYSARFADAEGQPQTLGTFGSRIIVVNFWATWCTPCREEMPGFVKLQTRWASRGVQFVGLANDEPEKVADFGRELAVTYPLWVGGAEVMDLSRRLGNRLGVLPHTAIIGPAGQVIESRIGVYSEPALEARLAEIVPKSN